MPETIHTPIGSVAAAPLAMPRAGVKASTAFSAASPSGVISRDGIAWGTSPGAVPAAIVHSVSIGHLPQNPSSQGAHVNLSSGHHQPSKLLMQCNRANRSNAVDNAAVFQRRQVACHLMPTAPNIQCTAVKPCSAAQAFSMRNMSLRESSSGKRFRKRAFAKCSGALTLIS